jgi:hypothetical protein
VTPAELDKSASSLVDRGESSGALPGEAVAVWLEAWDASSAAVMVGTVGWELLDNSWLCQATPRVKPRAAPTSAAAKLRKSRMAMSVFSAKCSCRFAFAVEI